MNWFRRFMAGRYGVDQLSIATLILSIVLAVVFMFFPYKIIRYIYLATLVITYFRIFSKNTHKRYRENLKFLNLWIPIKRKFNSRINQFKSRKTHKFFKCSFCGQKIRVPRGKGKIKITCPNCKNTMIRKS